MSSRGTSLSTSLMLAVVVGLAGAPSAAHSAPSKRSCAQTDPFERLACRQGALAVQMQYVSDTAFADGTKLHDNASAARLANIRNAKDKASRAERHNTKDTFKRQAKAETHGATQNGGHLVPLDARDDTDGDGICDFEQGNANAKCAAIDLDDSGHLQACNPGKKNKGKGKDGLECDLRVDLEADATPTEAEAAEQLDATYSATEDNLIETNQQLDAVNVAASITVRAQGAPCTIPAVDPTFATAARALRLSQASVFGAARIAADFGGQDFIIFGHGGNTRSVAVAFDSIALAVNIAYIVVDEMAKAESGKAQSAILTCVGDTSAQIAALQTQITDLQTLLQKEHARIQANDDANRATMVNRLNEVRWDLVDLLNTPLGQRPAFPNK